MSKHVSVSPEENTDRVAIRELVEAYAYCADLSANNSRQMFDHPPPCGA
jgi:hypothetical protein